LENRASFVTLTQNQQLRGCIGSLTAWRPLWLDVVENARSAAFSDPRFPPVTAREEPSLHLEISLLSPPEAWSGTWETLLSYLEKNRHGLILTYNGRRATFLPQVWEQIPEPEAFLTALAQKAGLSAQDWKIPQVRFSTYTVASFSEARF
jgi:AmmeMemoRadiSam system protein A